MRIKQSSPPEPARRLREAPPANRDEFGIASRAGRRGVVCMGIVLGALGAAVASSGCSQVSWRPDLGGAMRLAARQNRIVVVAYWSPFNQDCMEMERTVFTSDEVRETMSDTIAVRLDAAIHKTWAREVGVAQVPSFVAYAPDGRILRRHEGILNEAAFRGFVVAAKLSL